MGMRRTDGGMLRGSWIFAARFARNKLAVLGCVVVLVFFLVAFLTPLFIHISYSQTDLLSSFQPPSAEHLLGTDEYGRDVFIRLIYGGRVSMVVAITAMLLQLLAGVTLGAVAGYFGGMVDAAIMRLTDIVMCFPFYVLAIALAAVLGPGLSNVIFIIALISWTGIARIVRSEVMAIKEKEYITAARAAGLSAREIITGEILPNIVSPILVSATLSVANGIMAEATLSFLNLGVKLPQPSWGNMLSAVEDMHTLQYCWWTWVPPGICVIVVVLAINYISDGLRGALEDGASAR